MKKSPQTLQLETLLQMKQSIFLDWLNKSGLFPDLCPLTSFAQLADPKYFLSNKPLLFLMMVP